MTRCRTALRDGTWLTAGRLRVYPAILLGFVGAALLALVATSHGGLDALGRPLGTDFSQVWVAGRTAAGGHPAAVYDNTAHAAAQAAAFGPSDGFYTWPYPPFFLLVAVVAGSVPYLLALALWQAATLPLYLGAIARIVRGTALPAGPVLIAALAFPTVAINLLHGHNGFLTAGLLAWGLILLPRRPLLAGALFALLAYKPQFALALPVALAAGGYWTSLLAAAATLGALSALTILAFGIAPWVAFLASTDFTRKIVLEAGAVGFEKVQTMFAAVRLVGGSVSLAYAVQGAVTVAVLATIAWLWRTRRDPAVTAAALLTATLLTTPYALDYDEVVLGPALALAAVHGLRHRFAPWEKTIMAATWATPLVARLVGAAGVPIGPAIILLFFASLARRGRRQGVSTDTSRLRETFMPQLAFSRHMQAPGASDQVRGV